MLENPNNGNFVMPVSPMYGNGNGGGGLGGLFGDNGIISILILFLFFMSFAGGGFGNNAGNSALPFILGGGGFGGNVDSSVQRGFDQQAIMGGLNGITAGINGLGVQLCNGFNAAEQAAATRQMVGMQNDFAMQTAMNQGFNSLAASQASCCCENRLATANLAADIARENCADRQATSDAMMAISNKVDALGNQLIAMNYQNQLAQKDTIIAQKDDLIGQLRSEAMYNRGQGSQDNQTALIQAGQRALANEIEQYVAPKPIPAYPVQNPNCCAQQYGWNGCGVA